MIKYSWFTAKNKSQKSTHFENLFYIVTVHGGHLLVRLTPNKKPPELVCKIVRQYNKKSNKRKSIPLWRSRNLHFHKGKGNWAKAPCGCSSKKQPDYQSSVGVSMGMMTMLTTDQGYICGEKPGDYQGIWKKEGRKICLYPMRVRDRRQNQCSAEYKKARRSRS